MLMQIDDFFKSRASVIAHLHRSDACSQVYEAVQDFVCMRL